MTATSIDRIPYVCAATTTGEAEGDGNATELFRSTERLRVQL
jgi:hypothetical protein